MTIQATPRRLGAQLKAGLAKAAAAQLRTHMWEVAEIMGSRLPPHLQLVEASRQQQLAKAAIDRPIANYLAFTDDIAKLDPTQRLVSGYASTPTVDGHGTVIPRDVIGATLPEFMKKAPLREMHGVRNVGTVVDAAVDATGLRITAHVADEMAWRKVKAGVYKGFSVGGYGHAMKGNTYTSMTLNEISLCDRPCNPDCLIDSFKSDTTNPGRSLT